MTTPTEVKNIARQLYQEGHKPSFIAERCDVSLRTVRRWVRSFEKESVKVTGKAETPATEVLPALERIANPSSDTDTVSVNIRSVQTDWKSHGASDSFCLRSD